MRRFFPLLAVFALFITGRASAETISIVIASNAAPRVVFGATQLVEALKSVKLEATVVYSDPQKISAVVTGASAEKAAGRRIYLAWLKTGGKHESFTLAPF